MVMSCHQNTRQNHNLKRDNKSLKNVAKFKYQRMTVTNKNFIHEEIEKRLNLVQNLLFYCLFSKNVD
jgi:hypothetical protein